MHQTFSLFQKVYILRKSRLGFFKMVKITKDISVPTRFLRLQRPGLLDRQKPQTYRIRALIT